MEEERIGKSVLAMAISSIMRRNEIRQG